MAVASLGVMAAWRLDWVSGRGNWILAGLQEAGLRRRCVCLDWLCRRCDLQWVLALFFDHALFDLSLFLVSIRGIHCLSVRFVTDSLNSTWLMLCQELLKAVSLMARWSAMANHELVLGHGQNAELALWVYLIQLYFLFSDELERCTTNFLKLTKCHLSNFKVSGCICAVRNPCLSF
jgi:hypothetical protein